jgi:hypothetical protein
MTDDEGGCIAVNSARSYRENHSRQRDERGSGLWPGDTQHYVAALEMSLKNRVVAGIVPGIER